MKQKFYCSTRELVIKIFKVRKYLIRNNKDKKQISLTEVEILENDFNLIFTDQSAAKFIIKNFVILLYFIQPNNHEFIEGLKLLLENAKEILKE
jgi:hypothetical protein